MQIIIRRINVQDAPALAKMASQTFYETFTGTCTEKDMQEFLEAYFNIEQVTKELQNPDDWYFFAEQDGELAGYLRMMEDYSSFPFMKQWKALELKRIYVHKNFHGKGVAQALVAFAEKFTQEHQYEVLWLGVWEHNYRAKRFYEKSGFVDSGFTHSFPIGSTPQTDNWMWKFYK
jgi:diamine N-acetyltransferase